MRLGSCPHAIGRVTWHATDRIQVWANRPFNNKGEQLPLVHHARTTTRAKFRDFDDLAQWVERAALHPGVRVEWALTEQTKQAAVAGVRTGPSRRPGARLRRTPRRSGLAFTPEDIAVSATVDARFVASA